LTQPQSTSISEDSSAKILQFLHFQDSIHSNHHFCTPSEITQSINSPQLFLDSVNKEVHKDSQKPSLPLLILLLFCPCSWQWIRFHHLSQANKCSTHLYFRIQISTRYQRWSWNTPWSAGCRS